MNKPVLYSIFLILISCIASAQQNLVPNGSFEEYSSCPISNDLNNGQLELAVGWWKPTLGTSDYFNRCNTSGSVGVPNNFWGHQEPFEGDGYVGLCPYDWLKSTGEIIAYEYIQTKLIVPLVPCRKYSFSMYVSLAEYSPYAIGKLGALFTKDSLHINNTEGIIIKPNIENASTPITDSINWVKIQGDFVATGNERYLVIGCFEENIINDTIFIQPSWTIDYTGYYYIDSVSVVEIEPVENCEIILPNVFTPNGDGSNDYYDFGFLNSYTEVVCYIYNRWGNVVFEYNKGNTEWYGKDHKGDDCSGGVYYYVLKTENFTKTGFIQLIR